MSDQEYDRYHEYLEQKREELEDALMYPDPCTCEWRELRYGRFCVRRLCAHCKESIALSKRFRIALAAMPRPTVVFQVDDGRL